MPMLSMKTKKPMKPMLEILAITDDAGLSSPNQPASVPTSKPSQADPGPPHASRSSADRGAVRDRVAGAVWRSIWQFLDDRCQSP